MIEVGIVGLASFYGPDYANRIANRRDARVAGAVARTRDESLRALGRPTLDEFVTVHACDRYDEIEDLVSDVDAIVIASATTQRARDAVEALESGTPMLTAKPAAATSAGARQIAQAATASSPAMTTCPARFDDAIAELYERVRTGEIGDIVSVRGAIRHDRVPEAGIEANAEHGPEQAGACYAMGYYTADMLTWFHSATPTRIRGTLANVNTPHSAHPDIGSAVVEFDDGTHGTMTMTYSTDCREVLGNWELEVVGTRGIARTSHQGYEGTFWHAGDPQSRTTEVFGRTPSPILDRQLDAFLEAVESGEYSGLTPEPGEVANALSLCEAWEAAAARSEPVEPR